MSLAPWAWVLAPVGILSLRVNLECLYGLENWKIEKLKFHPFATPPQCGCRLWRHFLIPVTVPKFHRRKESHPMDCGTKKAEEKPRMSPYCLRGNNFSEDEKHRVCSQHMHWSCERGLERVSINIAVSSKWLGGGAIPLLLLWAQQHIAFLKQRPFKVMDELKHRGTMVTSY